MAQISPQANSNNNDEFFKTAQFFNPQQSEESQISEQISTNQSDQKVNDNHMTHTFKDLPNTTFEIKDQQSENIIKHTPPIIKKRPSTKQLQQHKKQKSQNITTTINSPGNILNKNNLNNNQNNNNINQNINFIQQQQNVPQTPQSVPQQALYQNQNKNSNNNNSNFNHIDDIFGDSSSQQEDKQFWEKVEKIVKQSKSNLSNNSTSTNNTSITNNNTSRNRQLQNKQQFQQQLYQYTNNNNILSNLDNQISLPPIKQKQNVSENLQTISPNQQQQQIHQFSFNNANVNVSKNTPNSLLRRPQFLIKQQQSENTYEARQKNQSSILNQNQKHNISQYNKKQSVPSINMRPYSNSENYFADSNEFMVDNPFQNNLRVYTAQNPQQNLDQDLNSFNNNIYNNNKFGRPKSQLYPYSSKNSRSKKEISDNIGFNNNKFNNNSNGNLYDTLQYQTLTQPNLPDQQQKLTIDDDIQQPFQLLNQQQQKSKIQLKNNKQQKISQQSKSKLKLDDYQDNEFIENNKQKNINQQQQQQQQQVQLNQPQFKIGKTQSSQNQLDQQQNMELQLTKQYSNQETQMNSNKNKKITLKFKSQENVVKKLFNKDFKIAKSKQSYNNKNNNGQIDNVAASQENPQTNQKSQIRLQRQYSEVIQQTPQFQFGDDKKQQQQ